MIAQQLINALILGSTYGLMAAGYTLVFGILNMLNFAHPSVFVIGGFLLFASLAVFHLPLAVALIVLIAGGAGLGYATELICFRRHEGRRDELVPAIASVAFALVISEVVTKVWGSEPARIPDVFGPGTLYLVGAQISGIQVVILVTSIALMLALDVVIQRTPVGYALRAVAEHREFSALLGINVRQTVTLAFVIAGVLASLGGMLLALRTGFADSNVGLSYGLRALAVMVIGGLGNVRGALVAGLLVGLVDVATLALLSQAFSGVAAWVLLILVLLFRPSGLMGTRLQRAI